jgi:hypothetical protein
MSKGHKLVARGARPSAGGGGRILQFNRVTERPIPDPLRHFEQEEDRRRMRQNLAAAMVIVLIITSGFWLVDHLRANARIAACVEAGHHDCVPLDLDRVQGR